MASTTVTQPTVNAENCRVFKTVGPLTQTWQFGVGLRDRGYLVLGSSYYMRPYAIYEKDGKDIIFYGEANHVNFSGTVNEGVSFAPEKNNLEDYEGVHPRLFYTQEDFETVKKNIAAGGTAADIWTLAKAHADKYYKRELKEFDENNSGENLWISKEGAKLESFAFAYKISGDKKYLEKAIAMTDKLLSYPYWATKGSEGDFNELAAEGAFIGISLFYDWCYDDIPKEKRKEILDGLALRGESLKQFDWYRGNLLQNHLHQAIGALMVTAMAIYDEYEGAKDWIDIANERLEKVVKILPGDGAGSEGHLYHTETTLSLVEAGILNEKFMNINMLDADFFRNTAKYTVYNSLAANKLYYWRDQFYNGDAPYYSYFARAPYTAYLADRYNDHGAMEYIEQSINTRINAYTVEGTDDIFRTDEWLLLRYYNPAFAEISKEDLEEEYPLDYIFEESGYGYMRQNWTGNEDSIAVRSGPIFGIKGADRRETYMYSLGSGHQHPDQGHFQIYSNGRWIFSDDGYTTRYTKNHSTLLIDGLGQYGCVETKEAFPELSDTWSKKWETMKPTLKIAASDENYAHMIADVTPAYPVETGLTKFIRNYIYLKNEKAFVVIDSVAANKEVEFAFRFRPHKEYETGVTVSSSTTRYRYYCGSSSNNPYWLDIEFKNTDGVKSSAIENLPSGKSGGTEQVYVAQNKITGTKAVNVTAISWIDRNVDVDGKVNPAKISVEDKGDYYTISAGSTTVNVKIEK